MPGVRAFGRKWLIAEDDIPVPASIMAIFHLVWIGPMISCYVITYDTVRCKHVTGTTIALSGLLFGFVCSTISEISCVVVGLRGTMFERSKRQSLPYFVYFNTFSHGIQVLFNCYLTYLIYRDFNLDCDSRGGVWRPDDFLLALCVAEWIYIGIMMLFLLVIFNPRGAFSDPAAWEVHYTWIMWLGFCCWNPLSARERKMQKERAKRVGANLCALFGHADITITDAWAAFIVARTLYQQHSNSQEEEEEEEAGASEKSNGRVGNHNFIPADVAAAAAVSDSNTPGTSSLRNRKSTAVDEALIPPQVQEINKKKNKLNIQLPSPPPPPCVLPLPEPGTLVDHATLVEAQHFFTYALATYGWMLYIFDNGISALAELACGCSPLGWHGRIAPCGLGQVNTQVAMKTLNASKDDILFLREEGALPDVVSYIIAADHSTRSIVVAVRGALSIMDNVRDLLFEAAELDNWLSSPWSWETVPPPAPAAAAAEPIDENEKYQKFLAQGDYLNVAYQTLADILRTGALKNAISGSNPQYPGYKLVLTGHSLGAAVSYLIALRLRLAIPDLFCWAFSPPLGLSSASLGAASSDWCTTVVCGKELPPRYSVATLDRALNDLMRAAAQCRLPKLQILTGWLGGTAALKSNASEGKLLWKTNEIPEEVQNVLDASVASVEGNVHRKFLLETSGTFGLPGRVFHLQLIAKHSKNGRNKENKGSCRSSSAGTKNTTTTTTTTRDQSTSTSTSPSSFSKTTEKAEQKQGPFIEREYQAVWIDSAELAKEGLQMSGRVISDHMPDFLAGVLRQVALVDGKERKGGEEERVVEEEKEEEGGDVEGGLKIIN